ncbi:MAG: pyridoxal phosphate-dependent aminotransferase [Lewinellaceae bacterium]|nr:pyridoxal phosphate-dependent aminotransferase [Lewinellaceae bacterium]
MPRISQRAHHVPLSPFRKLSAVADQAKARGRHVYHLNIGQPDIETPPRAIEQLQQTPIKILAYSPAEGWATTRREIANYYRTYGVEVGTDDIVITTGASEALQMLFYACFDHDDEVLIPEPFYANYNGFAQIADVKVTPLPCYIEDGFALPPVDAFEKLITPRTKAILITNPSNPTGTFYSREVLEGLAGLIKKHDLYLFVDEVYRDFCYDGQTFFSALRLLGVDDHVVVVDSVSKRYSACGARVGSITTRNHGLLDSVLRYAKLRLSPPGLGQLLTEYMINLEDDYLERVVAEYDRRRKVVYRRLSAMPGVVSYLPGGAFYCFAKFPVADADHFCKWLLEEFEYEGATVMLSPGAGFYATPGRGINEVRIAYILNVDDLEAAMTCLEKALEVYPQRVDTEVKALSQQV